MAAVVNYSPPWWVNALHRLPHFNLQFEAVSSDFRPEDTEYQKVGFILRDIINNCYIPPSVRPSPKLPTASLNVHTVNA